MNLNQNQKKPFGDSIIRESVRYGSFVTFVVMFVISLGLGYLTYSFLLSGWKESADQYRQAIVKKEVENKVTENMLSEEEQFRAKFKKVVDLYNEAKPLLPQETEVSEVLGQVETAAQRNAVTLTGLIAVKESVKSPRAENLYEREIPAVVTGPYPQEVRFVKDISRMSRILVVRDYSVVSLQNNVSAQFTLMAYHAPPPTEMPELPKDLVSNQQMELKK